VLVHAQVADTPERRQQGLSGRSHLPRDAGMVFLFFRDSTASFYMRDTVVPLSIAFFDVHGKILDIEDMDPCRREHCKLFSPGVPYRGALEVNQGAFSDWGVEVGDVVHVAP
jgi:uncharacterized membrane protein (UPF0127 family)